MNMSRKSRFVCCQAEISGTSHEDKYVLLLAVALNHDKSTLFE
jgi:hypothetical protein